MSFLPNWLTGYDAANADAAAAADAKLQALNAQTYAPGTSAGDIVAKQRATEIGADGASPGGYGQAAQTTAIDGAFTDSLQTSANGIIGTPLRILGELAKAILGAFPWWIWAAASVALFVFFGGPAILKAYIAKKSK